MPKLRLDIESLDVQSFDTTEMAGERGTVRGAAQQTFEENCSQDLLCTQDVYCTEYCTAEPLATAVICISRPRVACGTRDDRCQSVDEFTFPL